ncbi:MAG: hypothetical protein GX231_09015 [Tissierellia bacterium]|nr:hypothetical protein [Tissierellia bacterium]
MNRSGFITIFVLITFIICLTVCYFTIEIMSTQTLIQLSYRDKIQSEMLSESKILRLLEDESYFDSMLVPLIHKYFNNPSGPRSFKVKFEENMDELDTYKEVEVIFLKEGNKQLMQLNTKTIYKGFTSFITSKASIINYLFEVDKNPLITYGLSDETDKLLEDYFNYLGDNISTDSLSGGIKGVYTYDHNVVKIGKGMNNLKKITKIRNGVESYETFDRDVFLLMKNKLNTPIELIIEDNIDFRGILYIEGDLIINSDLDFKGIIILKGADSNIVVDDSLILDTSKKPKIFGIVLTDGNSISSEFIDIRYESGYIYRYGIYLPGFLQPKIELIKIS